MLTVIVINMVAILFAFLARHKSGDLSLKISFFVLFLFQALRYNYGNDYATYFEGFYDINSDPNISYFGGDVHYEAGWILLCRIFEPLGFFGLIAFLALCNCALYYCLIKKYVVPSYYWLAVFLYTFNPNMMLIHLSAIRQSIAIAFFIISLDYIYKKDVLRYFICIAIAALFHKTALILLPLYLIGMHNFIISKRLIALIVTFYVGLFVLVESLSPWVFNLINIVFKEYEYYKDGDQTQIASGLGVILYSLILLLILAYEKLQSREMSVLFKISAFNYFIIPFSLAISIAARIGFYFEIVTIFVFPAIVGKLQLRSAKYFILTIILLFTLYSFNSFFKSDVYREDFGTYRTIFSSYYLY